MWLCYFKYRNRRNHVEFYLTLDTLKKLSVGYKGNFLITHNLSLQHDCKWLRFILDASFGLLIWSYLSIFDFWSFIKLFLYVISSCWVNAVEDFKRSLSVWELSVTGKCLVLQARYIHSFVRYTEILSVSKHTKQANLAFETLYLVFRKLYIHVTMHRRRLRWSSG